MSELRAGPEDWRGAPIIEGRTVVYGAGVGRSIQMVEGTVDGFTKKGRVRIRITRRSYTSGTREVVDVGPDRLTVVWELPPSDQPTQGEKRAELEAAHAERQRLHATHEVPEPTNANRLLGSSTYPGCVTCGCSYFDAYRQECER